MKRFLLVKLAAGCLAWHLALPQSALADDTTLKTDPDKMGYAFGLNLSGNLKKQNIAVDPVFVGKGMKAEFAGEAGLLTTDQLKALFMALQTNPTNVTVDEKNFKNAKEEVGYAVGYNYAERLKAAGLEGADFNFDFLARAMQDTFDDKPALLSTNDVTTLLKGLQTKSWRAAKRKESRTPKPERSFWPGIKRPTG